MELPLPRAKLDRLLLALGAVALLLVIPSLWAWLGYGAKASSGTVYAGAIGLSVIAAGIGLAMIRILDGHR